MTTDNTINEFEVLHQTASKEMQDSKRIKSITKRESSTYHLQSGENIILHKPSEVNQQQLGAALYTVPSFPSTARGGEGGRGKGGGGWSQLGHKQGHKNQDRGGNHTPNETNIKTNTIARSEKGK